ncbi:AMP-binding protein [Nocardia cyriacigeorgica]|uniref:AMP-binding protein n=1 Tax=Nocardia cyriacigeorgica TaxID=135487 RepID=UPI0018945878|nr:AMP-binding protein [Nocardia cyriacigeorgica]MBF6094527.1 AMP-binding protein [Nocardia cyriacigeorgica]MBF6158775.1 AMP-binding protein [Nocardia cyriacigeorgica]MBF6197539.1 AMP-binding protein [Nocardia cyriacigeorgica]
MTTTPSADQQPDIARMLMARIGDEHLGLRTRQQDWTWDAVVRESAARAALAQSLRVDGPFHIGVLLDNVPDFVFWLGAAALAGATVVGINPTHGAAELREEIRFVDCQLIVTDRAGALRLRELDLGLAEDRFLVIDEPGYADLLDAHRADPTIADGVGAHTLLLLLFTSGTTGRSKAVKCSQGRLARLAYANFKYGHHRDDVDYCCMPLFHGNALMGLWAPALACGATICLTPKFSASGFLPDIRFFGATFFTYVGKALGYLMATPETPHDRDNRLERGFGTEAAPADRAEFARRFGAPLLEAYGSSEGAGSVRLDPDAPAGALGRPAHSGIAVVDPSTLRDCAPARLDEHGRVLNSDEAVGEMVNKDGAAAFEGYYNNPAADAERVRNGWYWTGDLGYIDEAGFLYFAGRRGDWIRVDGENTSALLIEQVVRRHPAVLATAAYAVPDPRSGDLVMAAIEIRDPEVFDPIAFASFLAGQVDLGRKATPRLLRVSSALPVTGSGKIVKRELQQQKWRTTDAVYRWNSGAYQLMSESDKAALEREFIAHDRQRLL